jgi:hypothetical protein
MTRRKGYMSIDSLNWILENIIAYNPEFSGPFHLHGSGECLLDRQLAEKIQIVQSKLPNARIEFYSTLGYEISENEFEVFIQNGLKTIHVSCYGIDKKSYQDIHGIDRFDLAMNNIDKLGNLKKKYDKTLDICIEGPFEITNILLHDIFKQKMLDYGFNYRNIKLHNYGKLEINKLKKIVKPCGVYDGDLSHCLQIDWDLKVIPCCMIQDQEIVFGDLNEKCLREIFYDSPWKDFRLAHKEIKLKDKYPFCYRCMRDSETWVRNNN